ncbi:nucleotidyltransferase [Paenibacillus sp. 1011MAR3C5]|uniref:nucleotidyltransferase n=1 Tax=Paenibacillus sp. 1011MAR3C5 TaxID=1675787 RepID=UPI000E6C541B|nr:nucleotidyltransferase [Paenibacillus sp. 1011MAR3C5]RJE86707.1 nucleotidyltransferase [Paenibacillus sp. 1011MAR3C5]
MRAVGLIVEYNPFHNGHLYHLLESVKLTEAEAVVAVMSGNFLQRGEPAMWDKWTRTRMALHGGCDLVIELPVAYATHAAEWFAYGAVSLLEATGVVDAFCFGTESGELAPLLHAAEIAADEPPRFQTLLRSRLDTGTSYPVAYSGALQAYLAEQGYADAASFSFDTPNHTLGLHYLIALKRIKGAMKPYTIAREKAQYHQESITDGSIASATAIRKLLLDSESLEAASPFVPVSTYWNIQSSASGGVAPVSWERYMPALMHKLVTSDAASLASYRDVSEGLEHRMLNALPELGEASFAELLSLLKTKRYTRTRLQRALLSILLGHAKADFTPDKLGSGVEYIRVLGFTEKGRTLLKRMRETSSLPILLSAARPPEPCRYLNLDVRASNAYMLGTGGSELSASLFRDYREKPVMI